MVIQKIKWVCNRWTHTLNQTSSCIVQITKERKSQAIAEWGTPPGNPQRSRVIHCASMLTGLEHWSSINKGTASGFPKHRYCSEKVVTSRTWLHSCCMQIGYKPSTLSHRYDSLSEPSLSCVCQAVWLHGGDLPRRFCAPDICVNHSS